METTTIYFITDSEYLKIGRSSNLDERKATLQVANAKELQVMYLIENQHPSMETFIHEICEPYHVKGEWFRLDALTHLLRHPWYAKKMVRYSKPL